MSLDGIEHVSLFNRKFSVIPNLAGLVLQQMQTSQTIMSFDWVVGCHGKGAAKLQEKYKF